MSSRGRETGVIKIAAWGASHCRVTLDLSIPGEPRRYQAVLDDARLHLTGPQELTRALAAPGWREGCVAYGAPVALAGAAIAFWVARRRVGGGL